MHIGIRGNCNYNVRRSLGHGYKIHRKKYSKLRSSRGLSQGDLGKEIGLTPSAISNIENAVSYPSIDTLIRFANFFPVTIEYLLSNKDIEQLGELQLKSKLLTTEMFLV